MTTVDESGSGERTDAPAAASGGEPRAESTSGVWLRPEESRSRRAAGRAAGALGIAVAFGVVLGLIVAFLARGVGEDPATAGAGIPSLTIPAEGSGSTSRQSVPADWVEQTSNDGFVYRAPPGWTPRNDAIVEFRVAPSPTGAPGVDQVGIGLSAEADPEAAVTNYAENTYAGQDSYQAQPSVEEVSARGEPGREVTLTYSRSGTPVTAIVRAYPTPRGTVLVVSRAAVSDGQRALDLVNALDASIRP